MIRTWLQLSDDMYALVLRFGKWLRQRRLWWRYQFVYGALYPPVIPTECPHVRKCRPGSRCDCGLQQRYSWLADFRAGWRNPPDAKLIHRRYT
jgi:hypothetical protein